MAFELLKPKPPATEQYEKIKPDSGGRAGGKVFEMLGIGKEPGIEEYAETPGATEMGKTKTKDLKNASALGTSGTIALGVGSLFFSLIGKGISAITKGIVEKIDKEYGMSFMKGYRAIRPEKKK